VSASGETASAESFRVIDLEDVVYLEADQGQVAVQTAEERFRADFRLKDLETQLDDAEFFRCHRSYVVRVSAIEAIEPKGDGRYRLVIDRDGDRAIPLARSRASQLKRRMPWSAHLLDTEI
jgi:DNA-binding LytR/AlgR family response regulator